MSSKNTRDRVASLAGVSSATVSRVYNTPEKVSPARREAVLKAARQLGYSPDKSASALRRKGTGQISLVSIRKKDRPWYWGDFPGAKWFFTDVLQGILDVVEDSMYRLNLKSLHSAEEISSVSWEKECDGIIFFDIDDPREAEAVASCSVPTVIGHHTMDYRGCNRCSTDNTAGGELAGAYLKSEGYEKPVYISYLPELILSSRQRYEGFQNAYGDSREVPLLLSEPGKKGGYEAAETLIDSIRKGEVDSLGIVNDMTAVGVIQCLLDRGIKPGRDVGLIGYDNMPFNYVLPFSLASVDLRPAVLYRECVSMLLEILKSDGQEGDPRSRTILPRLVEGDSV